MVRKEEYLFWKQNEITQEFHNVLKEKCADVSAEIVSRETVDIDRDQFLKGFIQGLAAAHAWEPQFEVEVESEEEPDDDEV